MSVLHSVLHDNINHSPKKDVYTRLVEMSKNQDISLAQLLEHVLKQYEVTSPTYPAEEDILQRLMAIHRRNRDAAKNHLEKTRGRVQTNIGKQNPVDDNFLASSEIRASLDEIKERLFQLESLQEGQIRNDVSHIAPPQQNDFSSKDNIKPFDIIDHTSQNQPGAPVTDLSQQGAQLDAHFHALGDKLNQLLENKETDQKLSGDSAQNTFLKEDAQHQLSQQISSCHQQIKMELKNLASKQDLAAFEPLARMQMKLCQKQDHLMNEYEHFKGQQAQFQSSLQTLIQHNNNNAGIFEHIRAVLDAVKLDASQHHQSFENVIEAQIRQLEKRIQECAEKDQVVANQIEQLHTILDDLSITIKQQYASIEAKQKGMDQISGQIAKVSSSAIEKAIEAQFQNLNLAHIFRQFFSESVDMKKSTKEEDLSLSTSTKLKRQNKNTDKATDYIVIARRTNPRFQKFMNKNINFYENVKNEKCKSERTQGIGRILDKIDMRKIKGLQLFSGLFIVFSLYLAVVFFGIYALRLTPTQNMDTESANIELHHMLGPQQNDVPRQIQKVGKSSTILADRFSAGNIAHDVSMFSGDYLILGESTTLYKQQYLERKSHNENF